MGQPPVIKKLLPKNSEGGRNFLSPVTYVGSGMDNFSNDL